MYFFQINEPLRLPLVSKVNQVDKRNLKILLSHNHSLPEPLKYLHHTWIFLILLHVHLDGPLLLADSFEVEFDVLGCFVNHGKMMIFAIDLAGRAWILLMADHPVRTLCPPALTPRWRCARPHSLHAGAVPARTHSVLALCSLCARVGHRPSGGDGAEQRTEVLKV